MTPLVSLIRQINDRVAIAVGLMLLGCVVFTLIEIAARRLGGSLGGVDEISGYVMAVTTSWGISYALTEQAHVRIDLLRQRLVPLGRAVFDMLALLCLAATAIVVAWRGWGVLEKTLSNGARANTPLETPLWIPQSLWWAGWLWFAVSASLLLVAVLKNLLSADFKAVDDIAGAREEA
ncbi:TRAP transporter small permease subunit [Roseibium aggregatum]|uniref:TRAP transporter small permease protein n=1 Tax=Roseibium aggregatum TaxID=187304 RepID=A0A939J2F4_9HYPH|nr:TRAP transporter small permease [Roseibium aggregatum]MBN9671368.1 TRAP transporter small permease [Roseibium aggregatum]